jgi:L-alanine-DL-glutamate epimerase-like enolase superfamily enzyme
VNIKTIECFKVNIPFKRKFVISHSARKHSESVFVNVALGNGILGWGESLPRPYVTGETQESVVKVLNKVYIPVVKKWDIKSYDEVINRLKALKTSRETNCALCALEIALLDALGKHFACGVDDLVYLEGSYNHFLLKYDITKEDLTFGRGGVGKPISGYGLGVEVNYQNAA